MIKNVLQGSQIGTWVIEIEEGKLPRMYADDTMLELVGVTQESTPEETYALWYSHIDESELETVQGAVKRLTAFHFAEVTYLYHHPTQGEMYVRCGGIRNAQEKRFVSLSGAHQNITTMVQLSKDKERLEMDNEELKGSLHNIFYALYRLDLENAKALTMRSSAEMRISGELDYDIFLERCGALIHSEDREDFLHDFSLEHLRALEAAQTEQFSREVRRMRGSDYRWTAIQVYFTQLATGKHFVLFGARDVHERRSREEKNTVALREACRAAEANAAAKTDFLSRMSHDLRTPINAVLGMTTLARKRMTDTEELTGCLDKIEEAAKTLSEEMNKLLTYSRLGNGQTVLRNEVIDLVQLGRACVDRVAGEAERKGIDLSLDTTQMSHRKVYADGAQLQEILMTFLFNGIYYTPKGGRVRLTLKERSVNTLEANSGGRIGYRLECEDTGIGISEEFQKHLFEPFSREEDSRTSKSMGSGLSLSIAQNIVLLLNGRIDVKSKKGEGSLFSALVYLRPVEETEVPDTSASYEAENTFQTEDGFSVVEQSSAQDSEGKELANVSILLVEDNEINREIAEELLSMEGAIVTCAANGQEAVDTYRRKPDGYDIILMDIKMPVMDGNEAAARIRAMETDRRIPIIALTANNFAGDVAESLEAGIDRHLGKPYEPKELYRVIRELLGQ